MRQCLPAKTPRKGRCRSWKNVLPSGRAADIESAELLNRAFRQLNEGSADTWQTIRDVAEAFWGPLREEHGFSSQALDEAEARLGIVLPEALRNGYQLIGRHPNLSSQDRLLAPAELSLDGEGLARFRVENQACAEWACGVEGLDPPVHYRLWGGEWIEDAGRTSEFFLFMLLGEALFTAGYAANGPADHQRIVQIEAHGAPLRLPDFTFWPAPEGPGRRFFGGSGTLIAEDAHTWLWIAATDRESMAAATEALPGEWTFDDLT